VNDSEQVFVAGLIQRPDRMVTVFSFDLGWFESVECKAIFIAARNHYREAASRGNIRFASGTQIVKGSHRVLISNCKRGTKKYDSRVTKAQAIGAFVDEVNTDWDLVNDSDWDEARDDIGTSYRDRMAYDSLREIVDIYQKKGSSEGLCQRVNQLASDLNPLATEDAGAYIKDDAVNALSEARAAAKSKEFQGIPTPYKQLNRLIDCGGGRKDRLWLVAGYTGSGKSTMALNLIHKAMMRGKGVAYLCVEQTRKELRNMFIARHTQEIRPGLGVELAKIVSGNMNKEEWGVLKKTVDDLDTNTDYGHVHFRHVRRGTSIESVVGMLEVLNRQHAIDVVVLDHTELFGSERGKRAPKAEELSYVVQGAKDLSITFNNRKGVWVILCHQINRSGYDRSLTRGHYLLSDLSGTSEAERSSDLVMFLWRSEELKDLSEIRVGIAKNRQGEPLEKGFEVMEDFATCSIFPIGN